MKNFISILLIITCSFAFGQTKKEILTKKWKLDKVEDFGQLYAPMDNQIGDWIEFKSDGKFTGIFESKHVEGTWSATGSKVLVTFDKSLSKIKINWSKIKTVEKEKFALEYQNGDLITSTLIFIPQE